MSKRFILLLFIIPSLLFAQEKFTLSGNIKDAADGEDLVGVTVFIKELPGVGTVTNLYGFYSITLPKGDYTVQYKYLGYQTIEFKAELTKNIKNNIQLASGTTELNVVEITAEKENQNIRSTE